MQSPRQLNHRFRSKSVTSSWGKSNRRSFDLLLCFRQTAPRRPALQASLTGWAVALGPKSRGAPHSYAPQALLMGAPCGAIWRKCLKGQVGGANVGQKSRTKAVVRVAKRRWRASARPAVRALWRRQSAGARSRRGFGGCVIPQ